MAYSFSRYANRDVIRNASERYSEQLSNRNLRFIDHFKTGILEYPSQKQIANLTIENEIWGVGSRFYKLASKHYGDPLLWWVIPWFNKLPLESDYEAGEIILIPKPLNVVLSFFD